ncbi:MAG: putative zinc-binding protein [Syntrophales bacterium]|nr:putative zinc-binding protein [Syntrophales bacterium]
MTIGILSCQGACNVGVMTNKIVLKLVDNETVNMVCPLGLPLGIKSIIDMANVNEKHLALNGCLIKCASKAFEYKEIMLTADFDIPKNKNFNDETSIDKVEEKVKEVINEFLSAQQV